MDFKTATDILGLPAADLAEAFNLQPQTIRQMRLTPGTASYRTPPVGWERLVADIAIKRSNELLQLVDSLPE